MLLDFCNTLIANISRSESNIALKFGQLIKPNEIQKKNICFLEILQ